MENNELKNFFNLKGIQQTKVACNVTAIGKLGTSKAVEGIDSSRFISVTLVPRMDGDDISDGGQPVTKTLFERTHPVAFAKVLEWKDLDEDQLKSKSVTGLVVTVPTRKEYVRHYRIRDANDPDFGELKPQIDQRTKQPAKSSLMSFFLFERENLVSELRRRGTQLETLKAWTSQVTTTEIGSTSDEL
ncbi:MAG: hypothetical protein ACP5OA_03410 [Candidatus Woesearchaeota archaeon]